MSLKTKALVLALAAGYAIPITALATNGMFLEGNGAKSRSMGGVGIAYTQDSLGNAMNPAGVADLPTRADVDFMLFRPIREVTLPDNRTGAGNENNAGNPIVYQSGSNLFAIPSMGGIFKFNRKLSMAMSFVGAGGGSTRYTRLSPLGTNFMNPVGNVAVGDTLGVSLFQAQMAMTGAYKFTKKQNFGASFIVGIQQFRAYGLGLFDAKTVEAGHVSNKGNDYALGAGGRIGWQGQVLPRVTMGATYASKIYFQNFDKYSGLFAEHGQLDSPANFALGIAVKATDKLDVAFDVVRVQYSDVSAIGNKIDNLAIVDSDGFTGPGFLGSDIGAGFGWEDQTIYKLGLKYQIDDTWAVQTGFNYGKAPMPKDQLLFSTLAPAVTEKHFTLGGTYKQNQNLEWTFAYVHAFDTTIRGKAYSAGQFDPYFPSDSTGSAPGDVALRMVQDSVELSLGLQF